MAFEHYVMQGKKRLRCGITTGSCAALAAKAAAQLLLAGTAPATVQIMTPAGLAAELPVLRPALDEAGAACAVRKDAGDDPDITDGMLVCARVSRCRQEGVHIEGGEGVGRVTKKGLDQPVGAAAINRVPRQMITAEVRRVCARHAYRGGLRVVISIPGGAAAAAKTFNPRLGIEGGLSVLGTSGIVKPMSTAALVDSIELEMRMLAADGVKGLIITPGNYGRAFLQQHPLLSQLPCVACANYVGDALDFAAALGFEQVLLVGHIGKFVKLAGGVMNTHSRMADCRLDMLALHAALAGAPVPLLRQVLAAVAAEEALEQLDAAGYKEKTLESIFEAIKRHVDARVDGAFACGVVLFGSRCGLLGSTAGTPALIKKWEENL